MKTTGDKTALILLLAADEDDACKGIALVTDTFLVSKGICKLELKLCHQGGDTVLIF